MTITVLMCESVLRGIVAGEHIPSQSHVALWIQYYDKGEGGFIV